jgi:putative transposase
MTMREIQAFMAEQYSTDVSPEFISTVTDSVMSEVSEWQSRPLDAMFPVVFFDAMRVKIRDEAVVRSKAIYLALGVLPDGTREILGLWIENTEGAPQRHGRGAERGVPGDDLADVHRALDSQQFGFCQLEGS